MSERRRREVMRRRAVAGLVLATVGVVAVLALSGGDVPVVGGEGERSGPEIRRATVSVSGDLLIHSPVYYRAAELDGGGGYDFAPMFARIRPWIERADLAVCHMEVPATPAPVASYPIFNAPTQLADGIAATGWDVCTTASNHTLDQGADGVGATIRALGDAGVKATGSAPSEEARPAPILRAGPIRVAVLAYTSDTNGLPLPYESAVNLIDPDRILADARAARARGAEAVIVNLHWASEIAPEYVSTPNEDQLELAARLLRAPAITALVGQGPHVVQPIQRIGRKYVVFSEGNLLSNQSPEAGLPAASQDGYVAQLELVAVDDAVRVARVRYVPVWVDHADYSVLPVGRALQRGWADPAALTESYGRTVAVAGHSRGVQPVPARLESGTGTSITAVD